MSHESHEDRPHEAGWGSEALASLATAMLATLHDAGRCEGLEAIVLLHDTASAARAIAAHGYGDDARIVAAECIAFGSTLLERATGTSVSIIGPSTPKGRG